jgi:hypothetical protein
VLLDEGITKIEYLRSSRERGGVVVHLLFALDLTNGEHARCSVNIESPISNGLTAVARDSEKKKSQYGSDLILTPDVRGARTRYRFV